MKLNYQRSRHGVALVIVLAFVVLLTGMVVAYFARTMNDLQNSNSSFAASKTDILARSATDIIVSDLKQEIAAGSTVATVGPNSVKIYTPTTSANMVPKRSGNPGTPPFTAANPDPIPNLIRRSVRSDSIAAPGVVSRASALSSAPVNAATAATQGQISFARWNKHYLIPTTGTSQTPVAQFAPPDWVFVTSNAGPKVLGAPDATVVGRYAYAIYDEGGLLDVNVAGYPSATTVAQSEGKLSSAYADLTALGIPNSSTNNQVDQLVGWRNYATTQPSNTFPGATFASNLQSSAASATSFYNFVLNNPTGFLSVGINVSANGRTDQAFMSRQELLRFQNTQSAYGFPASALQYLGTFSREVNVPSFYYPSVAVAANDPIASPPEVSPALPSINPNILTDNTLRMKTAGTANDGFSWQVGDPVVARRFSLDWLKRVSFTAATDTSTASETSDIHAYFGLYRATNTDPWTYCGSDPGTSMAKVIKTLKEVADSSPSREPNFFELLKAAIHRDSVGVTYGFPAPPPNSLNSKSRTWVANADAIDGQADLQILRIGANIIDQADADSYPTVIAYVPLTTVLYAYGIESLPYISALAYRSVCDHYSTMVDPGGDPNGASRKIRDQFVPVLWNPHRNATALNSDVPSRIQFYMTGKTRWSLIGGGNYSDRNDYHGYIETGRVRSNEIGLTGFDPSLPVAAQNSGSIIIPSSGFSTFTNPSLIKTTSLATASGAYGVMPFHTNGQIFGLTLQNAVYPSGRERDSDEDSTAANWNGYFPGYDFLHHFLNPGAEGLGVNAVLRYEYPSGSGKWHVYSAFASNEADPDGKIHTAYDSYGICDSNPTSDGIYMYGMQTASMPAKQGAWKTSGGTVYYDGLFGQNVIKDNKGLNRYFMLKPDPRTARFGIAGGYPGWVMDQSVQNILLSIRDSTVENGQGRVAVDGIPSSDSYRASTTSGSSPAGNDGKWWPAMWSENLDPSDSTYPYLPTGNGPGTYTTDFGPSSQKSGVVRPGDDYLGPAFYHSLTATGTNNSYQNTDSRPVMLNRPFRNVGELGYVFRDMPYKTLDLFSKKSVDAGLLDFFTVAPVTIAPLVAGKVDINTRQAPVLQAIMSGVIRKEDPSGNVLLGAATAGTIAADATTTTSTTPLQNKADLVTKLATTTSSVFSVTSDNTQKYPVIKSQREAPIRALAEVGNSRTWNLLIDVVAQTGRYPATANALTNFVVEGERRYWVHVAIDRYTGKVVDQQLEPVYE